MHILALMGGVGRTYTALERPALCQCGIRLRYWRIGELVADVIWPPLPAGAFSFCVVFVIPRVLARSDHYTTFPWGRLFFALRIVEIH